MTEPVMLKVNKLCKQFTLHNQGGVQLRVLNEVSFEVAQGQCLVLHGPSGTGKSSLLRSLYANYLPQSGEILVRHGEGWVDMVSAPPHRVLEIRRHTIGYVSQFLRVIPRVSTLDIVSEPLRRQGIDGDRARARAARLLARQNIPENLWVLAPSTFSGGERQRVNIAHCFVTDYPVILLDEPTASLDAENRQVVIDLMREAMHRGAALVGIFHDAEVREAVGTHSYDMTSGQFRSLAWKSHQPANGGVIRN
jgi:alpha-D-ribose 1-methylphosphonate 5-triphosphate synthase subunit PhnL